MKVILTLSLLTCIAATALAETPTATRGKKTGVLLVNHGSRSATWRQALLELEQRVRPTLLTNQAVQGVKTAFMEYTEPSIATRMKEFDADGFTDIVVIPLFLTVSSHTFDDIPTILCQKTDPHSLETIKIEKMERYKPRANTVITPNLDFTDLLKSNVLRRVRVLSTNPADEGLVMIAYGDATYEREWAALLNAVGEHVKQSTGIATHAYSWCGHVAHYEPAKTTEAIAKVLQVKKTAVVIPVLVAHDEMFQIRIIGDGIAKVPDNNTRVIYRPDSILPDASVEQWVIDIAGKYVTRIKVSRAWRQHSENVKVNLRRLNSDLHRDVGYFLSGLIFVYCVSGVALNHVNDWNPDFVIQKRTVELSPSYARNDITDDRIAEFTAVVGEAPPKVHDFPTPNHVKLYFDNATLLLDLPSRTGTYERVQRRPLIYETNVLHRNRLKGWKWACDVFGVLLIFLTVSGWFMLKGKYGVIGRGKWFIAAGALPPVIAIIVFELVQK